jgi:hypothetical protein
MRAKCGGILGRGLDNCKSVGVPGKRNRELLEAQFQDGEEDESVVDVGACHQPNEPERDFGVAEQGHISFDRGQFTIKSRLRIKSGKIDMTARKLSPKVLQVLPPFLVPIQSRGGFLCRGEGESEETNQKDCAEPLAGRWCHKRRYHLPVPSPPLDQ